MNRNDGSEFSPFELHRRRLLRGVAASPVAAFALPAGADAASTVEVTVEQNGTEVATVSPVSTDSTVVDFYRYDRGDGASANTPGGLEKSDASRLFFYRQSGADNPLSVVVIHDAPNDGSGGNVRFDFQPSLPSGGSWAVEDDPGETFTRTHADWGWAPCCTDGGAYRGGFGDGFEFTIDPTFASGIGSWELLDGDGSVAATLAEAPITVTVGSGRLPQLQKQELIDTIRAEASEVMLDFRAENLDQRAQELLVEIDQALSNEDETFQFEQALERMLTSEAVTASATRIGRDPARETAKSITELLIMLAFVVVAKAAISGAGRLGSVIAAKLDDLAATARRGITRLSGRPILPASAKRSLDNIIDEVNSRVDDWLGENADDLQAAGESIVSGAKTINDVFGLLTGSVIEALSAIKDFAIQALTVLFYDLYMTDDAEFDDEGNRTEPPGIGSSIDNRMAELDRAIDEERLEAAGADERDRARRDRISDFQDKRDAFLEAMELFDDVTEGASLAVLVLAGIAVGFYGISVLLSASGIGLTVAAVLSSAASSLVTIVGGIGTFIVALTTFSVVLGFGFLDQRRVEHDETVDLIVNYETVGGGS